jgi:phage/plasmid-associated DNA primase
MKLWQVVSVVLGGAQVTALAFLMVRDRRRRRQASLVRPRLIVIQGGKKRRRTG